jgi:phosphoesterase RecJ-like protein
MIMTIHTTPYHEIVKCLNESNHFLVTTHIRPDGDSLASVLILCAILEHLGKTHQIVLDDTIPHKLDFLKGADHINIYGNELPFDPMPVVLVLDSSDLDRIGRVINLFQNEALVVNIDHHPGNARYGHINLIDSQKSSTVELVYPLIDIAEVPWTPELATLVYTGILSDTGRFLFANTSAEALTICAEMVKKGAEPSLISELLYNRVNPQTMRAYARALSSLEFHLDDQVTCIHLSNDILCQQGRIDTEGFVDTIAGIEGVKAAFFMMEYAPEKYRVSFRSKGEVDMNALAGIFGGGGHVRASGCNIEGSLEDVRRKILAEIGVILKSDA